jgi:hypothetical protein
MKSSANTVLSIVKPLQDDSYSLGATLHSYRVEEISVGEAAYLLFTVPEIRTLSEALVANRFTAARGEPSDLAG